MNPAVPAAAGRFHGSIGLRWRPDTGALPSDVLGHIGYAVGPWKQGRGHAREALRLILRDAWADGPPHVDLTIDPGNVASQRMIEANGGRLIRWFLKRRQYGGVEGLCFRIGRPAPGARAQSAAGAGTSP